MIRIKPHITEKSYQAAQGEVPVYTFRIPAGSTKALVSAAVEQTYKVTVTSVRLVHLPEKVRRFRGIEGATKPVHKALVQLGKGQSIADFEPQQTEQGDKE